MQTRKMLSTKLYINTFTKCYTANNKIYIQENIFQPSTHLKVDLEDITSYIN